MKGRCEICGGRQLIRLPRHKPISVSREATAIAIDQSYSDFPCPECTPLVAQDKVRVVECHFQADTRFEHEQGYREHLVKAGLHAIANEIEERGFMRLQNVPADRGALTRGYRVTVGVVAPQVTASLEAERQAAEDKFGEAVTDIAIGEIDNWGSHYGHSEILKRDARRLIKDAMTKAKAQRPR